MEECGNGTCFAMCPEKERWMREREGLLHVFEMDEKTKNSRKPKADPSKIIKCFNRPAAGQLMADPSQLRPAPTLLLTTRYLLTKIVTRRDRDWAFIYDFIFDRLRAIRQDIIIQRIGVIQSIEILLPIVRFHVYASQRLCERNISEFDKKINNQHLLECLQRLLVLYEELDRLLYQKDRDVNTSMDMLSVTEDRQQMEAIYILLHLGNITVLNRVLSLPKRYRSRDIDLALKISISWHLKNYVRTCRLIQELSPLLACAVLCNMPKIRRHALAIMSSGYNSKMLTFPGIKLQEILLYNDINNIRADCGLFGLTFTNENVQFQKASFNEQQVLANSEMYFSIPVLQDFLPRILFECT
ncbi:germinal-center associated nuclear protein [Cephus cinctus]|uniref:Germinal-center associated nuclear protein n=1 Tax=Cephus cinctus TaxID=211228 RepID=A0AAJ7BM94_CEPCN|nr:germinal-center associated nuclear protein [Cephus cinctus]XP_015589618.1 germinal-center associated nuclear protein [Cephus cinctus]XP_015589619.1 germinal-center associated nuclear protein [Cephus cinctus]XP_015589620.1 germinal-center associated nuclear protein [Cephus cinctus]XP_015589622.1 germinal-center associated nuclear protein [Cephus cinctus]XP_015589623.1 germinal-center associated nuclear protein [Cephus cinctus]XP_024938237.1 germinal-center associated nuclear protein [Cephus